MGVYIRPDSRYFWVALERVGERPRRESTHILHDAPSPAQQHLNRKVAEEYYVERMRQLAEQRKRPLPPRAESTGLVFIYFVRFGLTGNIKIGRTVNLKGRLQVMQVSHPEVIQVLAIGVGDVHTESAIQRRFKADRVRGEFFRPSPALMAFIDDVRRATPALPPLPVLLGADYTRELVSLARTL